MGQQERHPQFIAAGIFATGVLFLAASIFEIPFLIVQPPGAYFLMALSIVFMFYGGFFFVKALRGQLQPHGETITAIRLQAIQKMESPEMLSQIARDDPDTTVRAKALEKLETIAASS